MDTGTIGTAVPARCAHRSELGLGCARSEGHSGAHWLTADAEAARADLVAQGWFAEIGEPVPAGLSVWCRDCFKPATRIVSRVPLCGEHVELEAERIGERVPTSILEDQRAKLAPLGLTLDDAGVVTVLGPDPLDYDDEDEFHAAEIAARRAAYEGR